MLEKPNIVVFNTTTMNKWHLPISIGILSLVFMAMACQNNTDANDLEASATKQKKVHPANATTNKVMDRDADRKITTGHLDAAGLTWLTMEQASELNNSEGKKFLVDVYTDWCGWCKIMDKKTFSDPEVKAYLSENYHLIKLNSEQHDPINFKGKAYKWVPMGKNGINQLAIEIIGDNLSYPTLVFMDENLKKIKSSIGYKKPEQLMAELKLIDNS